MPNADDRCRCCSVDSVVLVEFEMRSVARNVAEIFYAKTVYTEHRVILLSFNL